jgi:hypothetical protein
MATLKQIVLKAVELKDAADSLQNLQEDRITAQSRVDAVDSQIAVQQPVVLTLRNELKAMLNE